MEKLLISFSGGETSAFMTQWLWRHKQDEYEMIVVFANTGQENEETLDFVEKFGRYYNIPITWVEAKVIHVERIGTQHKIVDYYTATRMYDWKKRDDTPFEEIIKKYGIPNPSHPHCTRELKQAPINSYAKSIGWSKYYTAIGKRVDEFDRMNEKSKEHKLIYPLIDMQRMTKPMINFFWKNMPFRLELEGWQGNCGSCWKKSFPKLYKIAKQNPAILEFNKEMEIKYGNYIPQSRLKLMQERGETPKLPNTFFRKNTTANDIIEASKTFNETIVNDSDIYNIQQDLFDNTDLMGGESCEVFSSCGDD